MSSGRQPIEILIAAMLGLLGPLGILSPAARAQNPVPLINQPLVPDAVAPGGAEFTLTVNGTGFVSGSVVDWNGSALATTFVSGSKLTATVPASDIATAGTAWVSVVDPAPGGGTSNVVFFTATTNTGESVAFNLTFSPTTGQGPGQMALGDFNGDGKLDLAVENGTGNTVSILLGDGTGNFTLASTLNTPAGPTFPAVGDFNGDGKLDLAVASNNGNNTISVFLGDGTGHFTLGSSLTTGNAPSQVAVGDFNRDGKLDLVVTNQFDDTLYVFLGDGTGHFTLASSPATGVYPYAVSVSDFNEDGNLDLAVANLFEDTVSILLGDGTGHFSQGATIGTGSWPNSVVVGDYNGDGKLDLAVTDFQGSEVSILLGDGTGNFTVASNPGTGPNPQPPDIGDLNGDNKLDLALPNGGNNTASILLGDGTGNFTLATSPATGTNPYSAVVGDFNGDGRLDVAIANNGSNTVSILLQATGPLAVLSPPSLSFGTLLVGTTSPPQTVTLSNTGIATLDITSIVASANFSQVNNCGSSLAAGASCVLKVTFSPGQLGSIAGTVTFTDNAPDSPQILPLTGAGASIGFVPTSVRFGTQAVGTTSSARTVTLKNRSGRAVTIFGFAFGGSDPGDFAQTNTCGTSLAAGASCAVSVTFTPQAKGQRTATLNVSDNAGASPQNMSLSGYGIQ